ncbi:hypothetical protein BDV93DRAFT_154531 [Ceratobasidium sp. AG-I]|nr:hypothetical protein BDV93DRAFT_154531 [Ceratobasidium sp. AG-I]
MQSHANNRASLLANLRTGGVRSASGAGIPHTAAPGGSFQIPRFASQSHGYGNGNGAIYEDDEDLLTAQMQQMAFGGNSAMGPRGMMNGAPMTAAIADSNRFQQQQQQQQLMMMQMLQNQGGMGGFNGTMGGLNAEQQTLQLQLQNEIFLLQAKQQQQQQQFQAQIIAQAQAQQAQLQAQIQAAQAAQQAQSGLTNSRLNPLITRRVSAANTAVPSTAGPLTTTFDLGNGPNPRRAISIDQDSGFTQPPMTASLGGRFGGRAPSLSTTTLNPNAAAFSFGPRVSSPVKENVEEQNERDGTSPPNNTPMTAAYASTTVISGGTSLGALAQSSASPVVHTSPSKADSALSWRRPSVVAAKSPSPPTVPRQVTSSPPFRDQSPVSAGSRDNSRVRPQPLRFHSGLSSNVEAAQSAPSSPEPDVVATSADGVQTILVDNGNSAGSRSPASNSPTTPVGGEPLPGSREEASKRLYEGLGVGRPLSGQTHSQLPSTLASNGSLTSLSGASTPARALSQPVRQPRGPPTEVSELGPRNFASRVRSKAIGGLEAMIMARNRRQGLDVEAF